MGSRLVHLALVLGSDVMKFCFIVPFYFTNLLLADFSLILAAKPRFFLTLNLGVRGCSRSTGFKTTAYGLDVTEGLALWIFSLISIWLADGSCRLTCWVIVRLGNAILYAL